MNFYKHLCFFCVFSCILLLLCICNPDEFFLIFSIFSGCCSFRIYVIFFFFFFLHLTKNSVGLLSMANKKITHKIHSRAKTNCILNSFSIYKFSYAQEMEFTTHSLSHSLFLSPLQFTIWCCCCVRDLLIMKNNIHKNASRVFLFLLICFPNIYFC